MIVSEKASQLRKRIKSGELTLGSWIQIGHPGIMEYMSMYNFDWLTVDMEHTDISINNFSQMLKGASSSGVPVLARVKENNVIEIRQVLDLGASGVIVPLVNSPDEAKKAVIAAKYPPEGIRGFAFVRANGYGENFNQYAKTANDQIVVITMVESKQAIDNIDLILEVDGLDGVLIGPYDLSGSYGISGQTQSPVILDAMAKVLAACKRHKKAAGIHQVGLSADQINKVLRDGFNFVAVGMDVVFLGESLNRTSELLSQIRKEMD